MPSVVHLTGIPRIAVDFNPDLQRLRVLGKPEPSPHVYDECSDVPKSGRTLKFPNFLSSRRTDLPPNFHPAAIGASAGFTPLGAGGATCDRRSWSGLRSRSHIAGRLAA